MCARKTGVHPRSRHRSATLSSWGWLRTSGLGLGVWLGWVVTLGWLNCSSDTGWLTALPYHAVLACNQPLACHITSGPAVCAVLFFHMAGQVGCFAMVEAVAACQATVPGCLCTEEVWGELRPMLCTVCVQHRGGRAVRDALHMLNCVSKI